MTPHTAVLQATDILAELKRQEPLFHRPESGTSRRTFEAMIDPAFHEVGASGRCYDRTYVLDVLEQRVDDPSVSNWETRDFRCLEIAPDNYLLTYTLLQGERITRRATLWRRTPDGWRVLYHQGTPADSI